MVNDILYTVPEVSKLIKTNPSYVYTLIITTSAKTWEFKSKEDKPIRFFREI